MPGIRWRQLQRLLSIASFVIAVGGCASQPPTEVRVSVGTGVGQYLKADNYASLYVPYAKMSAIAYTDAVFLDENNCPAFDSTRPMDPSYQALAAWVKSLNASNWHCLFGRRDALPCPRRHPDCRPVEGLELHVWRRGDCGEIVIAFKGTNPHEIGDWISNFRWFIRFPPRFDEYEQVAAHISAIIQRARQFGCPNAVIIAVGHSLGGGLAQHAAYAMEGAIKYVYTFDPSPVTGYFDFAAAVRNRSTQGLGIDRAFEQGEILAIPREIVGAFFPQKSCDPRVRIVRFNVIPTGLPFEQHRINDLTAKLIAAAKPISASSLPTGFRDAQRCKFTIRS